MKAMTNEIARRAPLDLEEQIRYAQAMAGASLLPEAYRKQPANVLIAMQAAEALGITPFTAIQGIDVLKGKMSLSAELMRALVQREGHIFRVDVLTENGCRVMVARKERPDDVQQFDYTMDDARRAGLAGENWKKHPKSMLLARATTLACRAVFADVIGGMPATEEVAESDAGPIKATAHLIPQPIAEPVADEDGVIVEEVDGQESLDLGDED